MTSDSRLSRRTLFGGATIAAATVLAAAPGAAAAPAASGLRPLPLHLPAPTGPHRVGTATLHVNAPARRDSGRRPVLFYTPGHWGSHCNNRTAIEDLASRGRSARLAARARAARGRDGVVLRLPELALVGADAQRPYVRAARAS